jgi:DNA-binding CsgD family transcriptional regulator
MVITEREFFLLAERYGLSPRQRELVRHLLSGRLEDRQLAALMGVARSTIQEQFNRIFKKMHARSRTEVMHKFVSEAQLINSDPNNA